MLPGLRQGEEAEAPGRFGGPRVVFYTSVFYCIAIWRSLNGCGKICPYSVI